ncbi:hypothetical protein EV182_002498 [Spiromyces aspiralis]|uniref:Uncharacterized protein n=1 Tax=Spiromyces aspiralis TaxID=68401 RepID=A0ACC1HE31_9FUNG|nr:hypothetical protein EV182_002498 [Spiromyces aspiralis]
MDPTLITGELSLYKKLKAYLTFYKEGCKQLYYNQKEAYAIRQRVKDGEKISRKEFQLEHQAQRDFWKMIPFGLLVMILPESIPLFVAFIPTMAKMLEKRHAVCYKLHKEVVEVMSKKYDVTQGEFKTVSGVIRTFGRVPDLLDTSRLDRKLLETCLRFMGLSPLSLTPRLRSKLDAHLAYIDKDDQLLIEEGTSEIDRLDRNELIKACQERAISPCGLSEQQMAVALRRWVEIRKHNRDVEPLALVWSRMALMTHLPELDN